MRDIKFRAWDKKKNGWVSRNEWLGGALSPSIDTISVCSVWQHFNIEIMQYTGLKDKNGDGLTEVYEGDIISIDGTLKGNIYENEKEPTDIIIPQLGTKAWADAYKEAVDRGYNYSE